VKEKERGVHICVFGFVHLKDVSRRIGWANNAPAYETLLGGIIFIYARGSIHKINTDTIKYEDPAEVPLCVVCAFC
jgi:hypothetical protein